MNIHTVGMDAEYSGILQSRAALDRMVTSAGRAEQAATSLTQSTGVLQSAMNRFGTMAESASGAVSRFASKSGGAIGGLRGLGFQLNQVAQVGAMTGKWLEALAVQMPDILLGFGTMGIFAGIAAAAFIPLAQNFVKATDYAGQYAEAQKNLNTALREYSSLAEDVSSSDSDLAERYGRDAQEVRRILIAELRKTGEEVATEAANVARLSFRNTDTNIFDMFGLRNASSSDRRAMSEITNIVNELGNAPGLDRTVELYQRLVDVMKEAGESSDGLNRGESDFLLNLESQMLGLLKARQDLSDAADSGKPIFDEADVKAAQDMGSELQAQIDLQRLIAQYGEDSIEVFRERQAQERAAFDEKLRGLDISEDLRDRVMAIRDVADDTDYQQFLADAERLRSATDQILEGLQDQAALQEAITNHGQDSAEVLAVRQAMEERALQLQLNKAKATEAERQEAMALFDTVQELRAAQQEDERQTNVQGELDNLLEQLNTQRLINSEGENSLAVLEARNEIEAENLAVKLENMRATEAEADAALEMLRQLQDARAESRMEGVEDDIRQKERANELAQTELQFGEQSVQAVEQRLANEREVYIAMLDQNQVQGELRERALEALEASEELVRAERERAEALEAQQGDRIVADLIRQVELTEARNRYGEESIEVLDIEADHQRALLMEQLESVNATEEHRDAALSALDVLRSMETVSIASPIWDAADAAYSMWENLVNAFGVFRQMADARIQDAGRREARAQARLDTVGNAGARSGAEAVIDYRYETELPELIDRGSSMENLTQIEQEIYDAASAAAEAEEAARSADTEFRKMQRDKEKKKKKGKSEAEKEMDEMKREAEKWFKDTRTEAELYALEISRLNDLHKAGVLDVGVYDRALEKLAEKYETTTFGAELLRDAQQEVVSNISDAVYENENLIQSMGELAKSIAKATFEARLMALLFNEGPFGGPNESGFEGILSNSFDFLGGLIGGKGSDQIEEYDGGGYTGNGARIGGVDGKGGRYAVIHPDETIIDHTKGGGSPRSGPSVSVNVKNYAGDTVKASARQGRGGEIDVIVERIVDNMYETGKMDDKMQRRYGARLRSE